MSQRSRLSRKRYLPRRCERCNRPLPLWPQGGMIIENATGTEQMIICVKCSEAVLNAKGVKVIGDNVGRDM